VKHECLIGCARREMSSEGIKMHMSIDSPKGIRVLKAMHGDAFVLSCRKGDNSGVVVVDGGPDKNSCHIVEKLDDIGAIDLMILTHYDLDHIGGVLAYINKHKHDKPFPVKEIWCNCAYEVPFSDTSDISYSHAKKLADLLTEINEGLENSGYLPVSWQKTIKAGMRLSLLYAEIDILSPEENVKVQNDANYTEAIANISASHKRQKNALMASLKDLAGNNKDNPSLKSPGDVVNWSSIGFYLECDNMKVLMLGDGMPTTFVRSLKELGYSESNQIRVDYVKVSHHGSKDNISNELLDMIECNDYIISTNGGNGNASHPDRETIGNILYHDKRDWSKRVNIYFNYQKSVIENNGYQFLNPGEEEIAAFAPHFDVDYL